MISFFLLFILKCFKVDSSSFFPGYAWSGGGRSVVRVDVSADQGKTWHVAQLEQNPDKVPRHWAWTLWSAVIPVEEKGSKVRAGIV